MGELRHDSGPAAEGAHGHCKQNLAAWTMGALNGHNHTLVEAILARRCGKTRKPVIFPNGLCCSGQRKKRRHNAAAHEGRNQGLIGALTFSVKETAPKQSKEKPEKPGMPTTRNYPLSSKSLGPQKHTS